MAQYNIKQYQEGNVWNNPRGGGQLQSFFLDIEGYDGATIMTNKKPGNTPKLGTVEGDLIDTGKLGKKGQKIYQFKQAYGDAPSSAPQPAPTSAPAQSYSGSNIPEWFAPYAVMIKALYAQLPQQTIDSEAPEKKDSEDNIPGTNLSKAELEDIFGGPMEAVDIEE